MGASPALLRLLGQGAAAGLFLLGLASLTSLASRHRRRRHLRRSAALPLRRQGSSDSTGPIGLGGEQSSSLPCVTRLPSRVSSSPDLFNNFSRPNEAVALANRRSIRLQDVSINRSSRSRSARLGPRSGGTPLVVISDAGQDLDDEMSIIMMRYLVMCDQIDLRGIVSTLAPAFERALLIRGTLDMLGMHDVPVGIGSDGGSLQHESAAIHAAYIPARFAEGALALEPGRELLRRLLQEAASGPSEGKLTLLLIASTKDAAIMLRDHEELFVRAVQEVVIMGGCVEGPWMQSDSKLAGEAVGAEDFSATTAAAVTPVLEPDSAHNNQFDAAAARYLYRRCQELGVRLVVVSRWAAYACKVPRSLYDEMATKGSCIGWRLRNEQRSKLEALWTRSNATDPEGRQGLPARCTSEWFLKTFCSEEGAKHGAQRGAGDSIWDCVDGFMQYDTVALLAAVPELRRKHMRPVKIPGPHGVVHQVIGVSQQDPGILDGDDLAEEMHQGFAEGIGCNLRGMRMTENIILLTRVTSNALVDIKLCCVMLRALWSLGVTECLGILLEAAPEDEPELLGWAESIRLTLSQLGMSHVPVRPVYDPCLSQRYRSKSLSSASEAKATDHDNAVASTTSPRVSPKVHGVDHSHAADIRKAVSSPRDRSSSSRGLTALHAKQDCGRSHPLAEDVNNAASNSPVGKEDISEDFVSRKHVKCIEPVQSVLLELYGIAPPWGLVLVCSSGLSSVARFAQAHATLFREFTTRVVHMGGADLKRSDTHATNLEMLDAAMVEASGAPANLATGARSVLGTRIHDAASASRRRPLRRQKSEPGLKVAWEKPPGYELEPDSEATNNSLDMEGAKQLYAFTQKASVPLVVLSRHVAVSSRVPRQLFDVLADHGGTVGRDIMENQRACLSGLWDHVQLPGGSPMRKLPGRCDKDWFRRQFVDDEADDSGPVSNEGRATSAHFRPSHDDRSSLASASSGYDASSQSPTQFCAPFGKDRGSGITAPSEERATIAGALCECTEVFCSGDDSSSSECGDEKGSFHWEDVRWITVYSPLALLAAVPAARENLFRATAVRVRSATHHVIGVSAANPGTGTRSLEAKLRACLCQGLFSGCRQNASEYDLDFPGEITIGRGKKWSFEKDDETLREVMLGDDQASAANRKLKVSQANRHASFD